MKAVALIIVVLVSLAQAGDVRPTFLRHATVVSAQSEFAIQVRVPDSLRARTVTLEAWLLEDADELEEEPFAARARVALVRSSLEDVEDGRTVYRFLWRGGLDRGDYELLAVVALAGGRSMTSPASRLMVR